MKSEIPQQKIITNKPSYKQVLIIQYRKVSTSMAIYKVASDISD